MDASPACGQRAHWWFEAEVLWTVGFKWVGGLEQGETSYKDCSVDWDSGDKRRRWSGNVMEEKPTGIDS